MRVMGWHGKTKEEDGREDALFGRTGRENRRATSKTKNKQKNIRIKTAHAWSRRFHEFGRFYGL